MGMAVMLEEGVIMVMVMMKKQEVMVRVRVIKLMARINSGPGAQTYSDISLDQENSRKMEPMTTGVWSWRCTPSHRGVICGTAAPLQLTSYELLIILNPSHPQQSINQVLSI